jgi:putative transposase
LSTVSALVFTDSVSTKSSSDRTQRFKLKKRHSHKQTDKPQPNFVRKVRVYPDNQLAAVWRHWLAGCRFVYNRAIETLKFGFKGSSYDLEAKVLNNLPNWLKTVPRHPKANAVQDAYDAWKQARANGGEAKFRSCRQPTQSIKFKAGNYLHGTWFPQLTKGMTFAASQPLADNCSYGTQLVRDRRRWFAILPEFVPTSQTEQNKVIALDPGIRTFLTGYDGESVLEIAKGDIERVVRLCFHLDRLISRATHKSVKSKQRRSMLRAAGRIRIQIRNLVDEAHKQTASYLVRNYKAIFMPTFDTSEMVIKSKRRINKKSARAMLTWSHFRFKQLLKAMADRFGVLVVETNEAYTSKTCGQCGAIHTKLGGSKTFKCSTCGHVVDRDWNGAFNIMLKALAGTPFSLTRDAIEVFSDIAVVR